MQCSASRDSNRSLFISLALSVAIGACSFYTAPLFMAKVHAQNASPSPPVTVNYTFKEYTPTGALFLTKSREYMRFSDGSLVNRFTELHPKQQPIITEILNATTGDWIYLDAVTRSSMTFKRTPARVREAISEADTEGCPTGVDLEKLPQFSMLGMKVVYYANRDLAGDMVEKWMVTEFNCVPLKEIDTSPRHAGAHNEEIAISVKAGEPAEDLKEPPPDYIERSPEEVEQMHIATAGEPFWGSVVLQAMKRHYAKDGVLRQR